MRMASLWIPDDDGNPVLDPELGRSDDKELTHRVLAYLNSGLAFLRGGRIDDLLEPANGEVVPLIYMTDGEWIWSGEEIYYLEKHGVLPQAEFLAHMAAHGYTAPPVSREAALEAERILRG